MFPKKPHQGELLLVLPLMKWVLGMRSSSEFIDLPYDFFVLSLCFEVHFHSYGTSDDEAYAKTYKEFRDQLADYLGTTFYEMIAKRHTGTFYRSYTLTTDTKKQYAQVYGYDDFSLH